MYLKTSNPNKKKTFSVEAHQSKNAFGFSYIKTAFEEQKILLIQFLNIAFVVNFYDWN